jgi:1A family penicillin-binding protein
MNNYLNESALQIKRFFRELIHNLTVDQRELYLSVIALLSIFVIIPGITYAAFSDDLLTKEAIMNKNNTGLLLLDRNGNEFFRFYQAKNQNHIPLDQIPKHIQDAVIASEDKDFYSHSGFSPKAIVRSAIKNFEAKDFAQGGSTITQQLVKNSLLTPDKNLFRKYQEVLLAQQIEGLYTKQEILEMYLNSVYFGEGAFGIQEAAQAYFGKDVQDLSLSEASIIVSVLPAPSTLSPISGKLDEAKKRQEIVLQKMVEQGSISEQQKNEALTQKLSFQPVRDENNLSATHFALLVKDQLEQEYGEEAVARSGFVVKTTIDQAIQQQALEEVNKQVTSLAKSNANNGAAVVMNPKTGEVLAMVGSKDWNDPEVGKINMAVAPRSPGSSFKPIIYAAGFEKKIISPGTIMQDKKTTFRLSSNPYDKPYEPKNYDGRFRGNVTVRRSLANSLNIPSVEIMQKVGLDSGMEMAKRLGISTLKEKSNYGLSFVLGSAESRLLDMTAVYAVFANDGMKINPTLISEIKEKNGKILYTHKAEREPVLRPEVAFLISSILSDNKARSEVFGNALTISRPAAVKTGTSEDYRDAWTIGYTPSLVVGVWVGNNDNKPMSQVAGSLGAAPIWKNIMEKVLQDLPKEEFIKPAGVTELTVCAFNGLPLRNQEATSSASKEYFIRGTEPRKFCTVPKPTATPSATPGPDGQTPPPTPEQKPESEDPAVIQARIQDQMKEAEKEIEKRKNEMEKEAKKEGLLLVPLIRNLAASQTVWYS